LPAVIIAAVMVLTAAAVLMPATETDAATAEYLDIYGDAQTSPTLTSTLSSPASIAAAPPYTINSGATAAWYYIDNDIDLGANGLTISGVEVNLIIGADCVLSVGNGITVDSGTIFNLYTEVPGAAAQFGILYVNNGNGVNLTGTMTFTNTAEISARLNGVYYNGAAKANIINGQSGFIYGGDGGGLNDGIKAIDALILNYGAIQGTFVGVEITGVASDPELYNYSGSISGGSYGVDLTNVGYIYNNDRISGELGVLAGLGVLIDNDEYGQITGAQYGLYSYGNVIVNNDGFIYGNTTAGIFAFIACELYNLHTSALVSGGALGVVCSEGYILNAGTITGSDIGIYASYEAYISNYPGSVISAGASGEWAIDINGWAYIWNAGTISGPDGIQISDQIGGFPVINEASGEIEATSSLGMAISITGGDEVSFINVGIIKGSVVFLPGFCYVYLGADSGVPSLITGDLIIGSHPSSELVFFGEPDPVALTYATVGGIANIGTASVSDILDLPAGYSGQILILIDALGGIVGTPGNATVPVTTALPANLTLGLSVISSSAGDQLIAGAGIGSAHGYYIKAFSDAGSTITPSGIKTFNMYDEQKYVFAAKPGYIITEVWIDYLHNLSPAQIALGEYTFTDIMANHSITVKSIAGSPADLTLRIDIKSGSGYAEYSIDGGSNYTQYTTVVIIAPGTNLLVRAVAEDGSLFDKWETPAVETTPTLAISDFRASKVLNLYFSGDSSNPSDSNLLLILVLILLVLIVLILLYFLFKKRKSKAVT